MFDGDRLTKPNTPGPSRKQEDGGPSRPTVPKPSGDNELLRRMRKIDPEQAKRYRQRSGE